MRALLAHPPGVTALASRPAARAAALACALALGSSGSAQADVFVPADPPPLGSVRCAAGAGDVLAASVDNADMRVSLGGGAWTALEGLEGCPAAASAPDGTAAVTGEDRETGDALMRVRVAGGAFGAPISLGPTSRGPRVAVAPGGWAAAVWVERESTLVAAVARPDGTLTRTVLDGGDLNAFDLVYSSAIAIDAHGDSTVIWQHATRSATRLRVARGTAGGAPAVAADLSGEVSDAEPSLAVAASGAEVLAWSTRDGVFATVGGAPEPVDVTSGRDARVTAAVADGGATLVAYTTAANEVAVVDRLGAAWSQPRVIAAYARRYSGYDSEDNKVVMVGSAVAPDGRAAVLWVRSADGRQQLYGAVGRVGGTWGAPQRLSAITRSASPGGLWLDATGAPRVLWSEEAAGLRGATVAAAPLDTIPPSVTTRFPSSVPPTRTGRFTARVRVQCSELCDARLSFVSDEYDGFGVVRSLAAGRARVLELRADNRLAAELRRNPKARRVRLRLVVTDRAGNVVRRAGLLRVRVIEKPIRSLKVAPDHDFGMKTTPGNRLVAALVNDLIDVAASGRPTERALQARWARGRREIRRAGHREIGSDRVHREIYEALVVPLTRAGYDVDMVLST
jgi:hypothetical protein